MADMRVSFDVVTSTCLIASVVGLSKL